MVTSSSNLFSPKRPAALLGSEVASLYRLLSDLHVAVASVITPYADESRTGVSSR